MTTSPPRHRLAAALSGTITGMVSAPSTLRGALLPVALLYVLPWLVYLALLRRQPDDPFVAWHNDVAWPAEHFLTIAQGGLVTPMFGHLMIGAIGGLFLAVLLTGLVRLACHLLRARDRSGLVGPVVLVLAPLWAFVFLKAVPITVTVVDPAAHRLDVHDFHPLLRYPTATTPLRGEALLGLDLTSYPHRRTGTRYVRLFALTADDRRVQIGERACEWDEAPCLDGAVPDVLELARRLGRAPRLADPAARPDHRTVLLSPAQ